MTPWPARAGRTPRQVPPVPAWQLTEGSTLPGDRTVVLVEREPAGGTVYVLTDEPGAGRVTYRAEDQVDIVRLLL